MLRSQDYDGKLTWRSSNEEVVKVNAETGELTIVGIGKAYITISGAETDYRLAPSSIVYFVEITESTGINKLSNSKSSNSKYYDLQGRPLRSTSSFGSSANGSSARKTIVIIDGKKMLK